MSLRSYPLCIELFIPVSLHIKLIQVEKVPVRVPSYTNLFPFHIDRYSKVHRNRYRKGEVEQMTGTRRNPTNDLLHS